MFFASISFLSPFFCRIFSLGVLCLLSWTNFQPQCDICNDKLPLGYVDQNYNSCSEVRAAFGESTFGSFCLNGNWRSMDLCERSCADIGAINRTCCPCITGTQNEVNTYCADTGEDDPNRLCCSGNDACSNWDVNAIATVCPGSCNFAGDCRQLADGVIIDINSCNSNSSDPNDSSCANIEGSIGSESCNGPRACSSSTASYIRCESCNGEGACRDVSGSIGLGSCNAQVACNAAAVVGGSSCNALNACSSSDIIGDGACNSTSACDGAICAGDGQSSCSPGGVCGEDCPSEAPSLIPSESPSVMPSSEPSDQPSKNPSPPPV